MAPLKSAMLRIQNCRRCRESGWSRIFSQHIPTVPLWQLSFVDVGMIWKYCTLNIKSMMLTRGKSCYVTKQNKINVILLRFAQSFNHAIMSHKLTMKFRIANANYRFVRSFFMLLRATSAESQPSPALSSTRLENCNFICLTTIEQTTCAEKAQEDQFWNIESTSIEIFCDCESHSKSVSGVWFIIHLGLFHHLKEISGLLY